MKRVALVGLVLFLSLGLVRPALAASTLTDSFNRSGASLGVADSGQTWTASLGSGYSTNGTNAGSSTLGSNTAMGAFSIATIDTGGVVQTVTAASSGDQGAGKFDLCAIVRYVGPDSFWFACIYRAASGGSWYFYGGKDNGGSRVDSIASAVSISSPSWPITLSISVTAGNVFTTQYNGAAIGATITDAYNSTATRIGFGVGGTSNFVDSISGGATDGTGGTTTTAAGSGGTTCVTSSSGACKVDITGDSGGFFGALSSGIGGIGSAVGSALSSPLSAISSAITAMGSFVVDGFQALLLPSSATTSGASTMWNTATTKFPFSVFTELVTFPSDALNAVKTGIAAGPPSDCSSYLCGSTGAISSVSVYAPVSTLRNVVAFILVAMFGYGVLRSVGEAIK